MAKTIDDWDIVFDSIFKTKIKTKEPTIIKSRGK
jgi:hypothetical protein